MSLKSLGKLRLWHLSVVVAVAALIFGAIRFLDSNRAALDSLLVFVGVLIWMLPAVSGIHFGTKLAEKLSRTWKDRGRFRGGLAGIGLSLVGFAIQGLFLLGGIILGIFFIILTVVVLIFLYSLVSSGWNIVTIRFSR